MWWIDLVNSPFGNTFISSNIHQTNDAFRPPLVCIHFLLIEVILLVFPVIVLWVQLRAQIRVFEKGLAL